MPRSEAKIDIIKTAEWIVAILLSALVSFLLIVRATHAGALWRDECDALQLARMPMFGDVVANLKFTSFPILFPATVRTFTTLFGTSDASLRCFGLAMGVALLGIAWFNARIIRGELPFIVPALAGLNITFLTIGTSIRGYGLGCALAVLAFGLTARFVARPTAVRLLTLFLSYIASMQFLFFDAALVPAIMLAAFAVCALRGQFKWALSLCVVAAICAISYIPQFQTYFVIRKWTRLLIYPTTFGLLWQKFQVACGEPVPIMAGIWLTILSLSILAAAWRYRVSWRGEPASESNLLLFGLLTIVTSAATYFAFLRVMHNEPQTRYYVALLCLLAAAAELIIGTLCRFRWVRVARLLIVITLGSALPFLVWPKIFQRETNVDLVVKVVEPYARPDDLILVNPWFLGPSFSWYYHGRARWMTVPHLSENRIHRFDLVKAKMEESDPLADVRSAIHRTLESGNRVWFVGYIVQPSEQNLPLSLAPAPDPQFGWSQEAYMCAWSMQVDAFLKQHALESKVVLSPAGGVNENENLLLVISRGWRD